MAETTVGRALAATDTPDAWLELEDQLGSTGTFATIENVAEALVKQLLSGSPVLDVQGARGRAEQVSIRLMNLEPAQVAWVASRMTVEAQQQRGAWWLPEEVQLNVGTCSLPALLAKQGDYGLVAADGAKFKVAGSSPDAMLTWALLEPLATTLLMPLLLRTSWAPNKPEVRLQAWQDLFATYEKLGLADSPVSATAKRIGPEGEWRSLGRDERQTLRLEFLQSLRNNVGRGAVQRLRAIQLAELVAGLYRKAKPATAMPLARTVLTKARQPVLSAWFASDWLAFLAYLGESANPGEQLAVHLPQASLIVATPGQVDQVAEQTGLSSAAVDDILRAYVGSHTSGGAVAPAQVSPAAVSSGTLSTGTPVTDRVAALASYFGEFDTIHAKQQTGMAPLWGLVDEGIGVIGDPRDNARRYRQLLSPQLTARIDELWEGTCLPRYPDRVVSEMHPHRQMADALGPAIRFWNGVALTCWFICEGPYSRTDIAGLAGYHSRDLAALSQTGTPVDLTVFDDLRRAEKRLGPETPIVSSQETVTRDGLTLTLSASSGSRRDGFEHLNEIVTRHRRAWMNRHLSTYLNLRWRGELESVFREFQRLMVTKGKPPTHRQFAGFAAAAANHWFNGDLTGLYAALGEKPPASTRRIDALPGDVYDLCWTVYSQLGGTPFDRSNTYAHPETYGSNWDLGRIAALVPRYIQLQEALDRPPTAKELGGDRINWPWPDGEDAGMVKLGAALRQALALAEDHLRHPASSGTPSPAIPPPTSAVPPTETKRGLLGRLRRP